MSEKQRLDAELVARGIIQSREQAKAAIMAGQVYVNNQKADKAGEPVTSEDKIEFRGEKLAYVSRVSITRCLDGLQKTAGGYAWKESI